MRLTGLIAAPFTPMTPQGDIALETVPAYAAHLARCGVRGVLVGGTTGESMSLTVEERIGLFRRWIEAAPPELTVMLHIGHTSLTACQAMAEAAARLNATALSAMAPGFFKPGSPAELADFLAAAVAPARDIPFYYYHIPSMAGPDFPALAVMKAAAARIPTLTGLKFTHEDLMDFQQCLELDNGRYDVLFGRDEALLPALAIGARGAIGSTYNFVAPLYTRLLDAFARGDLGEARQWQSRAQKMIAILAGRHGVMSAGKALMKRVGVDCGPCRKPLPTLTAVEEKEMAADLERLGFFGWLRQPADAVPGRTRP